MIKLLRLMELSENVKARMNCSRRGYHRWVTAGYLGGGWAISKCMDCPATKTWKSELPFM